MLEQIVSLSHRLDGSDQGWCHEVFATLDREIETLGEPFLMFGQIVGDFRLEHAAGRAGGRIDGIVAEGEDVPPALRSLLGRQGPLYRLLDVAIDGSVASDAYQDVSAAHYLARRGLSDEYWMFNGLSIGGAGVIMGLDLHRPAGPAERRLLEAVSLVVAHLGAGYRLRSALAASEARGPVEAVLGPDGRVLHAEDAAKDTALRHALGEATRTLLRTHGRPRDPLPHLLAQRVLVAGRWTLVDHTDTDGRRMVLARVNDPQAPGAVLPALSHRERQVAMWLALGWSLKQVAYELGLSLSTVHGSEQRARRKLGLATRTALVRAVFAALDDLTGSAPADPR